jgi:hypothetical protein
MTRDSGMLRTVVRTTLWVLACAVLGACGSDGGSSGTGGTSGSGATGGGGSGGSGGIDCCPAQRPTDGDDCSGCGGGTCTYLECGGIGKAQVTCTANETWQVVATPCEPFDCGGTQCAAGQICLEKSGGAQLLECVDDPCPGEPLTCGCGADVCPGTCQGFTDLTLHCNTCPSGTCP